MRFSTFSIKNCRRIASSQFKLSLNSIETTMDHFKHNCFLVTSVWFVREFKHLYIVEDVCFTTVLSCYYLSIALRGILHGWDIFFDSNKDCGTFKIQSKQKLFTQLKQCVKVFLANCGTCRFLQVCNSSIFISY